MPKIAVYKFLTFFIYSFDVLNEPPHLHIVKERGRRQRSAKIWLESLVIAEKGTLNDKEINQALRVIKENKSVLLQSYKNVKENKKIKTIKFK